MAKQLNVNLAFNADVKQAQAQIAQLQKSLDNLMSSSIKNGALTGFDKQIANSQQSVLKLKTAINNSLNADTGRLDLSKFNMQLTSSGLSMDKLASDMSAMGADGQKAFLNLANSIVTAQKPMVETNKLLDGMWTVLKNTARWQMSSSILHGLVGALQGAYGYAQDLDKSLNNIRIVTGQSTEQMAAFAEQANKSAQALSVSTTAYTDAALIYYQQGLSDAEVKARTDVTMMMSNVTGESAEYVSSYMTAIWNNFAEGSTNLEHFADVITALGAATASSSEEIANGMQQFAAVADTVGLSYEYAASALATVVAQTRQSESTVGNAFRTIFSRLQSLKLGETLEDGVGLTKYTEALQKAGVEVLNQNGELKDMDTILNEIGERWQQLNKTQRTTLAETVGGVRQYTNLVALFNNWDKFQENLTVAQDSDGSLAKQAEIYAESWEAAQKRVRAAWQALYQDLIDDKFFISLADGFTKVLQVLDKFIDSVGGLPGILSLVGAALTTALGSQLTKNLENAQLQLGKIVKPIGDKRTYAEIDADKLVDKTLKAAIDNRTKVIGKDAAQQDLIIGNLNDQLALNKQLRSLRGEIADKEYKELEGLIKITGEYAEQAQKLEEIRREKSLQANKSISNIRDKMIDFNADEDSEAYKKIKGLISGKADKAIASIASDTDIDNTKQIDALVKRYADYGKQVGITASDIRKFIEDQVALKRATEQAKKSIDAQTGSLKALSDKGLKVNEKTNKNLNVKLTPEQEKEKNAIDEQLQSLASQQGQITRLKEKLENTLESDFQKKGYYLDSKNGKGLIDDIQVLEKWAEDIKKEKEELKKRLQELNNQPTSDLPQENPESSKTPAPEKTQEKPFWLSKDFAAGTTKAFQGISQITMGLSAMSNVIDVLNNKELTPMEKVSQIVPSLVMAIPALIGGITSLGTATAFFTGKEYAAKIATDGLITSAGGLKAAFIELYLPLILIAGAIGLVVGAIKIASDAYNADAIAAEKAAKKAEETAEAFNKAKTEFDSLKSTLEDHQNSVNALNDLKQGTDEWYESVAKLNQEVLDLINQYPELAKYVQNINGSLQLSKEGMQEYLNTQYRELHDTRVDDLVAQREKRETQIESDKTDLSRSIQYQAVNDNGYVSTTGDNLSAVTATKEELNAAMAALQEVSDLGNEGFKEFAEALKEDGITNENLVSALWDHKASILELSEAVKENEDVNEASKDLLIQSDVQNEMGQTIDQILSNYENGEVFADDIKSRFAEVLSKRFEADELSSEEYVKALQGLKDDLTNNFDKVMQDLENWKLSDIGETLKSNGMEVSNEEIKQKLESDFFTEEQRKIIIEYGIDEDAESWEDVRQSAQDKADELKKILHDTPVEIDTDGLSKKQAEKVKEEFADLTEYIKNNATEIDELDDHLAECTLESSRLARAIIRFDDAIQDVTDNYADWNKALKSGSMQAATKAAEEMRKSYGNLLDIDGSVLSDSFLRSTENLDLMKAAINGSEDAYNQLAEAANQNILDNLQLSPEALTDFNNQLDNVKSMMTNFPNLEVGADLDDGEFLNELTRLVNMAGMTAAEAEAYLANMGIDATVTQHDTTAEETQETASFQPKLITKEGEGSIARPNIDGTGSTSIPLPYTFYGVRYEPIPDTVTTQKENKSFSLKVTSAHKSSGGNFKYNHANHGGGGAGSGKKGGGCFASGTLVTTNHNYKNIEDIKVGDIVLSYNEKTKKNEYSKVLQTMIHNVYEKIYDLFVKDDKLKVTGNHRFLVVHNNEQKWIEAADLQVGDLVLFADGTLHQISKIKTQTRFITVYNFEVSNTHNYYVGENQILAHNKGGGSKKGSERKPKEPVKYEKKEDRYHDLKEQLEDVRLQYDKVNKAKERAFGKSKLKYLDLEIKELQKEDKLLKDYVKEAEKYYQIDRSKVEDLNIDAKFDKNGALINYEEVLSHIEDDMVKATDEYNKAIAAWNAGGSDEDFEKAEKAKKNAEELQKTRMDALKKLEDTYNTWQDKVWEEIQKRWEIYDAKLEKVTLNIEIELEFNEDDLKLLQFIFDHMGDSADTAVDKIANLNEQMKEYDDNIKHIRSGLQGIFANHGIEIDLNNMNPDEIAQQLVTAMDDDTFASELTDKEAKTIRDYISQLMDNTKNLEESFDKVFETVKEGYDQWNERLQDQMGEYARLNKIVSSYKDLVSLTGKDAFGLSYDELNKWNQELVHVAQNQAESAEKIWKDNEKLYQNAVAMYNTAETEEEKKKWKEIMDQRKKTTDEAHQDYLDKVNEWQEAVQTAFEEALDYAKDKYEKSFGQYNFNFIEDEYERLADLDKLYLKPYEKYHDLQKSLKELGKSITDTTNPTVLNKMLTLQDEINDKMASGVQMSSYETGIIERRVALLQAEADLQNAKNAKGAVRMTRDNEGNFSYTYTADQDAIDEAQENLSEKFYELLKFERDSLDEIQSRILEETRKYQETLDDLARTYGKDSEEYQRYAKIVTDDHIEKMRYLRSQSDMLYGEMARLRDDDWHDLERIFGYKLASTDSFLTQESETLLGRLFREGGIFPTIKASEEQYLKDIETDVATYGANTQAVVDNVTTNMKEDIKSIGTTADETKGKINDLGEQMKKTMLDADTAAKGIAQTWAEHMKKVRDDTTSTAGNLNELLKKLNSITTAQKAIADGYTAIKNNANAAAAAMQNAASSGGGGGSGGGGTSGGGGSPSSPEGNPNSPPVKTYYMYYVKTPTGSKVKLGSYTSDSEASGHFYSYMNKVSSPSGVYCLYRNDTNTGIYRRIGNVGGALGNKTNISRYGSGGYTGDWGDSSGKLAILHRKEIVLNKEDTSNFLDAIGIVRSIKDFIDMGARNLSNVFNYNVMAGAGTTDLQQQVYIDASFPNVQSHNEIELALNNLINSATQYVNRK